jgi:SAM-dependent methyltransferase
MKVFQKLKGALRGAKQRWGSPRIKRRLWNGEFASGRWDVIETTPGDCVYAFVEKYCHGGSILDLGCGSGNTGCELAVERYSDYTGVDISDVAIEKAIRRSTICGRNKKNCYVRSDIATYVPSQEYDVILFRESIYYIPRLKVRPILDHYSRFLKTDGVIIIRWHDQKERGTILELLCNSYELVDLPDQGSSGPVIVVFRPKVCATN